MASKKVVAYGETKDEVDEVTDLKFESEDEDDGNGMLPHQSSEMLDTDIDEEIKLFLKQELISEQDVSEDGVTETKYQGKKSQRHRIPLHNPGPKMADNVSSPQRV